MTCLCGDKMWYADCPYLVPAKAPVGWKKDPAKRAKVNEALKDSKVQARVTKSLESRARIEASASSSSRTVPPSTAKEALTTYYSQTTEESTSGIGSFLIHDGGSNVHICNSQSAHLYKRIRDADENEYLYGLNSKIKIEHWGEMHTAFDSPTGLNPIVLQNVAFAGQFLTSVVSGPILDSKNVNLNFKGPYLFNDDPRVIKFQLYRNNGKYTFTPLGVPYADPDEIEPTSVPPTALATEAIRIKPASKWHKIMGHPSGETIRHLEDSSAGIKVLNSEVPKTNQCETCALTKSQRIISRSNQKSDDVKDPFYRISVDLMQFEPSLNGHEWATHIACMTTDFNLLDTHRSKADCREFILDSIAMFKRKFKRDVVII